MIRVSTILFALATLPFAAIADPDKDESGHGKYRHGRSEFKHEYRDGNCKVEIKQKKNGDYKEERKCKGHQHVHAPAPVYVVPQPVVVAPQPVYVPAPAVVVEPGVTIRGTIHLK
ncbi:conserved hypothetical protein [Ramlibacter tataouinensis TTB310]|uniref:Uncharacterized protein n=1 Tax=Ramlibacter tataouinensis (strain ATCC BAA-407 / DSM 14655 / LMG 21543 / TTB310) TaxID=365046 RepID=F5Y111_RAMTT|nr:conserved hypothetical protein [Ramlibacter tataouinensis TTB310]